MSKSGVMQTDILDAKVRFVSQHFVNPLVLSTGSISELTEARVEVTVRAGGREATGRGSIYLSDLWAWPDAALSHEHRDAALRRLCKRIAGDLPALCGGQAAHPTELGLRLHENVCDEPAPPALARAMCASPFDAAIHDAVGIALNKSAFEFYKDSTPLPSADRYFAHRDACDAIARTIRSPRRTLRAWYIVGKNDSMEKDVAPWVRNRGYRCFKIKVLGRDNAFDVARTVEVFRTVKDLGARNPWLSVDANEANPDADSVLDYLKRLKATDAEAFAALQNLEQPTGRDIAVHRFDWREVTKLKPVMLDEGLTGLDLMEEAAGQGWSGFALKTCKGHSVALVAAAWAKERGLLVSLQDLTNPGLSLIHAALFAAYVPMINDVELNSPQFTPAANADWLPRLSGLFEPTGGVHRLPEKVPPGLGSIL
ncbi:MAG: enolase C-terminal domain-like protein [Planctomycetota bacterium]|nr:enolase C-terminal domain-like protein [Planctomycetota bacterium]